MKYSQTKNSDNAELRSDSYSQSLDFEAFYNDLIATSPARYAPIDIPITDHEIPPPSTARGVTSEGTETRKRKRHQRKDELPMNTDAAASTNPTTQKCDVQSNNKHSDSDTTPSSSLIERSANNCMSDVEDSPVRKQPIFSPKRENTDSNFEESDSVDPCAIKYMVQKQSLPPNDEDRNSTYGDYSGSSPIWSPANYRYSNKYRTDEDDSPVPKPLFSPKRESTDSNFDESDNTPTSSASINRSANVYMGDINDSPVRKQSLSPNDEDRKSTYGDYGDSSPIWSPAIDRNANMSDVDDSTVRNQKFSSNQETTDSSYFDESDSVDPCINKYMSEVHDSPVQKQPFSPNEEDRYSTYGNYGDSSPVWSPVIYKNAGKHMSDTDDSPVRKQSFSPNQKHTDSTYSDASDSIDPDPYANRRDVDASSVRKQQFSANQEGTDSTDSNDSDSTPPSIRAIRRGANKNMRDIIDSAVRKQQFLPTEENTDFTHSDDSDSIPNSSPDRSASNYMSDVDHSLIQKRPFSTKERDRNSRISDDRNSTQTPAPTCSRRLKGSIKSGKHYSRSETLSILTFLHSEDLLGYMRGKTVYQLLEKLKITRRSAKGMRGHIQRLLSKDCSKIQEIVGSHLMQGMAKAVLESVTVDRLILTAKEINKRFNVQI